MNQEKLIHVDPARVKAEDNARFGLKPYRIDRLAEQIAEQGGVQVPVELAPLEGDPNYDYLLTAGFYRHAAVTKLNKDGAGLTLPAIAREVASPADRLRRQLSENIERENMSPMDEAVAIKKMKDLGMSTMDIRKTFARAGGKKGFKIEAVSNSFVNMRLSFLDFPKDIQKDIHDGRLGVAGAYELTKHPKDKWAPIRERYEAARLADIEREEALEKKLLQEEKKAIETSQAAEEKTKEHQKIAETLDKATQAAKDAEEKTAEAFRAKMAQGLSKEDRAAKEKAFREAEGAMKQARKSQEEIAKEAAKAKEQADKAAEAATKARAKIEAARAAKKAAADAKGGKKPGTTGAKDVQAAAAAAGSVSKGGPVALNASQMRDVIKFLILPGGSPKVTKIGEAFNDCFSGKTTDRQLATALGKITGERKDK